MFYKNALIVSFKSKKINKKITKQINIYLFYFDKKYIIKNKIYKSIIKN